MTEESELARRNRKKKDKWEKNNSCNVDEMGG